MPNIWRSKKLGRFGAVVFVDVYLCLCVWWQPSKGEKRPPLGVKPNKCVGQSNLTMFTLINTIYINNKVFRMNTGTLKIGSLFSDQ